MTEAPSLIQPLVMAGGFYLLNSHAEIYRRLTQDATLSGVPIAETPADADAIVYIKPTWPDRTNEPLRSLTPRSLNRVFVWAQEDEPFAWAPGFYASLDKSIARRGQFGGFYLPPGEAVAQLLEGAHAARTEPSLLWSFVGTFANAPVRQAIGLLVDEDGFTRDTSRFDQTLRWRPRDDPERQDAMRSYVRSIVDSHFVVCPRGRGVGSIRIFEAMQAGRCPVIIADEWLEPPLADWNRFSIRISERDVNRLPAILRERAAEAPDLGLAARQAWEDFYGPATKLRTLAKVALETSVGTRGRAACLATAVTQPRVARCGARHVKHLVTAAHQRNPPASALSPDES